MSIRSKERVADYGEVFTSEREVNAMLDLVRDETQRIESRFLDPACGDGNFLSEILARKTAVVGRKYRRSQADYEKYCFLAVSSIYGLDILADNVQACRQRLFDFTESHYVKSYPDSVNRSFLATIQFVLSRNILLGDTLQQVVPYTGDPIVLSEWSFTSGSFVKRTDYKWSELLAAQPMGAETLFSDLGEAAFVPTPYREYGAVHYQGVWNAE